MFPIIFLTLLTLCWTACTSDEAAKTCKDYLLPINITSQNFVWGFPTITNNYDLTEFNMDLGSVDSNFHPVSGVVNQSATYQISGTFCAPVTGGSGTVLLASHGLGSDRSIWNPTISSNYSFVDFTISKGYSVFFYDRLGVGKSSAVSGYVAQVSNQVAILKELVALLRSGSITKPKKIVLLGYSFGCAISNSAIASIPGLADAAVLIGFGYTAPQPTEFYEAWQPRLANTQSSKWGGLDGGYVTWVDIYSNVITFFKKPFYDVGVVEYSEMTKTPFALMEIVSLSATNFSAPAFTGPVLVLDGQYDYIFCGGYCPGNVEAGTKKVFPASKNLSVYIQPGAAHSVSLSLNATGAFGVITDFLAGNGF